MTSSRQRRKAFEKMDPHTRARLEKMDDHARTRWEIKRAIMQAATGVIERDAMVAKLQQIYNSPDRTAWDELNLAWQTNWISADEYQQILDD